MLTSRLKRLLQNPKAGIALFKSMRSTFSQYGEDQLIMLLLHLGGRGTYVDVGSHHPIGGSNTY